MGQAEIRPFAAVSLLIASILLAVFACVQTTWAQTATGNIVGTVKDETGGVIPGVEVVLTNQATGERRSFLTSDSGDFRFPLSPVGTYTLSVSFPGFKTFVRRNIRLEVDQNVTIPVVLETGEITTEVTVEYTSTGVDLVDATMSEVIDERRIIDLPLNGRSPLDLQMLVPGVLSSRLQQQDVAHGQGQNEGFSVNGNRGTSNYYLLDGVDFIDSYLAVPPTWPAPDALQEFSVQTSNFGVQYGRNSGAIVNAVTKSGGNEFHGTLFEFFRNDVLNANNFFGNQVTPRPGDDRAPKEPFKLNQFGGTIGGSIVQERTFFFGYYQGTRQRRQRLSTIPTVFSDQQRPDVNPGGSADFSDLAVQLVDPATGDPFSGNLIPASRIDPAAAAFVKELFPRRSDGTRGPARFFAPRFATNDNLDGNQFVIRIDHSFSEKDKIFGRHYFNNEDINGLAAGNVPRLEYEKKFKNNNSAINWTHTFSPSLINTFTFGLNRVAHSRNPAGFALGWEDLGGPPSSLGAGENPFPGTIQVDISGSLGTWGDGSFVQNRTTFQYADVLSWVKGKHSITMGADVRREGVNRFEQFLTDPIFAVWSGQSGDVLADFLLGRSDFMRQDSPVFSQLRHTGINIYAEDNIKLLPNLTLDLGVRWEPFIPPDDKLEQHLLADPTFQAQSTIFPNAPRGILFPGDRLGDQEVGGGVTIGGSRWSNFAPRIGLAWDPFNQGTTSIRAAYGVFWDFVRLIGWNRFSTSQPFAVSVNLFPPAGTTGFFASPFTKSGTANPFPVPVVGQQAADFTDSIVGFRPPVIDAGSVPWVFPALEAFLGFDYNRAYVQEWNLSIQQQFLEDYVATITYVGNKATHLWISRQFNPFVPGSGSERLLEVRGLDPGDGKGGPAYGPLEIEDTNAFSTYHALQVSLERNFAAGFGLNANYVWSKFLDVVSVGAEGGSGPRNPFNLFLDKGPSQFDVRHRFVASAMWQIPRADVAGVADKLINGWQVNSIVTLQSGRSLGIGCGCDNLGVGFTGATADPTGQDPDISGSRSNGEKVAMFFNTAAFKAPVPGTAGLLGRNPIRGPKYTNVDLSVFKTIPIAEETFFQFRAEFFNVFNNVNLTNPDGNVNSGTFGQIFGALDPRFVQFGLKILF